MRSELARFEQESKDELAKGSDEDASRAEEGGNGSGPRRQSSAARRPSAGGDDVRGAVPLELRGLVLARTRRGRDR